MTNVHRHAKALAEIRTKLLIEACDLYLSRHGRDARLLVRQRVRQIRALDAVVRTVDELGTRLEKYEPPKETVEAKIRAAQEALKVLRKH